MSATRNAGYGDGWSPNVSVALSKSGYVLQSTHMILGTAVGNSASVYNIYTHASTDLSILQAIVSNGYSNLRALQIDDNGSVLVDALHQPNPNGPASDDLLLLIPSGSSPNPIEAAAPEPAASAGVAMTMAAIALHRLRERRLRR
jgi:hypothetical protein